MQLPLSLYLPPRLGPDDFLVAPCNAAAYAAVQGWPDWPDRVMLILGGPGSGKTHLAHLWALRAEARFLTRQDIMQDVNAAAAGAIIIEDADRADLPEAGFFHLLNLVRDTGSWLLLTACCPPDRWPITTADLRSRLRLAPSVSIEPPDETFMRAMLVKAFDDRQVLIDAALIDFLCLRLDRSLAALRLAVEALDAASLVAGRRITRTMAAEVLRALGAEPD